MKNRIVVLGSILLLVMIAMAAQPQKAQARDNVYVGVDLGGLVMGFNTYPHHEYIPPPYPARVYYPRYRHYPPPPPQPVYYDAYYGDRPRPHHHRHPHWRGERW